MPNRLRVLFVALLVLVVTACANATATSLPPNHVTPTASTKSRVLYATPTPGPGCDKQGGKWQKNATTTLTCMSTGVQVGNDYGADVGGLVFISAPGLAALPTNYLISIDIKINDGIFGAGMQFGHESGGFDDDIYIDGAGPLFVTDATGRDITLKPVPDTGSTIFHLEIQVRGQQIQVAVNGHVLGSFTALMSTSCRFVTLVAGSGTSRRPASATMSNFTISALS